MSKNSLTVSTFFQEINIKTMLLGSSDTGKSAFLQRLVSNEYVKVPGSFDSTSDIVLQYLDKPPINYAISIRLL